MGSLPDEEFMADLYADLADTWTHRNEVIADGRRVLSGENEIQLPKAVTYRPRPVHSFEAQKIQNEKVSRFGRGPNYGITAQGDNTEDRNASERLENWTRLAFYEMNMKGDSTAWEQCVADLAWFGGCASLIERAPAAFWPDLVPYREEDEGEDAEERDKLERVFETPDLFEKLYGVKDPKKARENLKREAGLPVRRTYVPFETILPYYEGPVATRAFHVEQRTVNAVMNNPTFDTSELRTLLNGYTRQKSSFSDTVTIARYCDDTWYGYYALFALTNGYLTFPDGWMPNSVRGGMVKLHAYKHNNGSLLYAIGHGRGGGWRAGTNTEVDTNVRGIKETSEALDEMLSQALTYVRAVTTPTTKTTYNPEYRDISAGIPDAMNPLEGRNLSLWMGEDIQPIYTARDIPMFGQTYAELKNTIHGLGGSPALFGLNQQGVYTGIHSNQMVSQAESLDSMIEKGLVNFARREAEILYEHVRQLGEDVPLSYLADSKIQGRKYQKWVSIGPKDLRPKPVLEVSIEAPSPIDVVGNSQAFINLTSDRGDKGPALSDDTAMSVFLPFVTDPAAERRKKLREQMERSAISSAEVTKLVLQKIGMELATAGAPEVGGMVAGADPTLVSTIGGLAGSPELINSGGLDPALVAELAASGIAPGPTPLPATIPVAGDAAPMPPAPPMPGAGGVQGMQRGGAVPGQVQMAQQVGKQAMPR